MKLVSHNINFFRTNVEEIDRFYRDVQRLGNEKPFETQQLNQDNS